MGDKLSRLSGNIRFYLGILCTIKMFSLSGILKKSRRISPRRKNAGRNFRIPLIGEKAPSFITQTTSGTINFPFDFGTSWKMILSHPMDFTPVCSTEILELAKLHNEFEKLGVEIITVSTDPLDTHNQWKKSLEQIKYKKYPRQNINFPIADDSDLTIAKLYGMIHIENDNNRDVRGVFFIDPDNIIRAEFFYPMEVGRNMNELLRTVIALQKTYNENVMTPANWDTGNDVLVPFPLKTNMTEMNKESGEYYQFSWFLIFKRVIKDKLKSDNRSF
jgi:peroxiredoxin (alkyl hydroperoxide reductase subunit C)